jgi:hypothetical protein
MREFKRERRGKIEKQRKRKLEQRENILHWRFSAKHLQSICKEPTKNCPPSKITKGASQRKRRVPENHTH